MNDIELIAKNAKQAALLLATLDTETKNNALKNTAKKIQENKELILEQNNIDLENAKKMLNDGTLSEAVFNRLKLNENKFNDMISGILDVIKLPDPINNILMETELDNDLILKKISCPLGVIGVIFEARPDVIVQISSLAIKSSNAVILKGGKEASATNKILFKLITEALNETQDFPQNAISLIKSREDVSKMLEMDKYIDLVIPRGSNALVRYIKENTKIPVLGHSDGICHIYIDSSIKQDSALNICLDAKIQYPAACNAVETILVNKDIAQEFLPKLYKIFKENNVLMKGCEKTVKILPDIEKATNEDWATEYGDKIISVKIVNDVFEAINHINTYGSGHTDCIISENKKNVEIFMNAVDSAGVYNNVSTRFSDGFRYGFGAEVGISTSKTHARGPVGLDGLTIYKYRIYGNGQIVADYTGKNAKKFTHKRLK